MLADRYETVLLDLDGVVLLGEEAIPGAPASIRELRDRGRRVRFVTNNSRSTRETIARTLRDCGIDASPAEVVSSGWATAEYVAGQGVEAAYVIGTPEVAGMLRERGVSVAGDDGPDGEANANTDADGRADADADADGRADATPTVDAVVVGHDDGVTFADVERAARLIYHGGADFVAANTDGRFPTEAGITPGTGAITAAIEAATDVAPTVVGKPEPYLFEVALDGADPAGAVMVGDNPSADVAGAGRAGIDAVLVTGESGGDGSRQAGDDPAGESVTDRDDGGSGDRRARDAPRPVARVRDLTGLFEEDPRDRPAGP